MRKYWGPAGEERGLWGGERGSGGHRVGDFYGKDGERELGHPIGDAELTQALTLKLWALVALALSPGSTDAPTAIFLLGETRQRVAATLEGGMWRGIRAPLPHSPPFLKPLFFFQP